MGIISTITRGASSIGAKMMGKGKKPHAQVTGVVTDGKGEIVSVSYDGVPHKPMSQKLRDFNKKIDEKMKAEHPPAEPKEGNIGFKQKLFGNGVPSGKVFGRDVSGTVQKVKDVKNKITPRNSTPVTWGGRPIGQVAGEAAGNILRGAKKGIQTIGKSASSGYTQAKAGYIKAEPERQYLQFMSGVHIAKKTNVFKGKNFVGGAKRGRKTKAEKKAMQKEILYQQNVVARLKKNQTNQGLGSAFGNFDLPMGMSFSNSESISAKPFVRKTDNPYDINAHFNKARIKL